MLFECSGLYTFTLNVVFGHHPQNCFESLSPEVGKWKYAVISHCSLKGGVLFAVLDYCSVFFPPQSNPVNSPINVHKFLFFFSCWWRHEVSMLLSVIQWHIKKYDISSQFSGVCVRAHCMDILKICLKVFWKLWKKKKERQKKFFPCWHSKSDFISGFKINHILLNQ